MGYGYYGLVPVAVLHDNPGITKEEFAELLMRTNVFTGEIHRRTIAGSSWDLDFTHVWKYAPGSSVKDILPKVRYRKRTRQELRSLISRKNLSRWDNRGFFREGDHCDFVHKGLHGLAGILNLKHLATINKRSEEVFLDIFYARGWPGERNIKYVARGLGKDQDSIQSLLMSNSEILEQGTSFPDISSLVMAHPELNPEVMFDFSQKEGGFSNLHGARDVFRWHQTNGRYYFDKKKMFEGIESTSRKAMNKYGDFCGYTDFVITLEAVRRNAWKLLTYNGLHHRENFFKRWPDARRECERAVWDAHTSAYAKSRNLSNTELMRFRLSGSTE